MSKDQKSQIRKKEFYCPLGHSIMWSHGLEYKDCPIGPCHRDMPECKGCKLQIDQLWEENKEAWKDKPVKKKKRFKNRKKKRGEKR